MAPNLTGPAFPNFSNLLSSLLSKGIPVPPVTTPFEAAVILTAAMARVQQEALLVDGQSIESLLERHASLRARLVREQERFLTNGELTEHGQRVAAAGDDMALYFTWSIRISDALVGLLQAALLDAPDSAAHTC